MITFVIRRLTPSCLAALLALTGCQWGVPGMGTVGKRPATSPVLFDGPVAVASTAAKATELEPRPGTLPLLPAPMIPAEAAPSVEAPPVDVAPRYAKGELLVALKAGVSVSDFMRRNELASARLVQQFDFGNGPWLTLRMPAEQMEAMRASLATAGGVSRVSYNYYSRPHAAATDPRYGDQWAHLPAFADTQTGWDKLTGVDQSKVIVAIIDSGCDFTHEEFRTTPTAPQGDRLIGARNVTPKPEGVAGTEEEWANFIDDDLGHGTLTAGIIGATRNNALGGAGVAFGVRLMPIKADNIQDQDDGSIGFRMSDIVAGIAWACNFEGPGGERVRVINMSLGDNMGRVIPVYYDAVQFARRKGILVVASTGNVGSPIVATPANTPGVVAVGSSSRYLDFEFVSHFSNYGDRLDLVAPGGAIFAPIPTQSSQIGARGTPEQTTYAFASGTSEAAPFVAGVAALVFAKYDPNNASVGAPETAATMVDNVRQHLFRAVDDFGPPGWDPNWGYGRINVRKALESGTLLIRNPAETHKDVLQ